MNGRQSRPRSPGITPALIVGDLAMVALCVTAIFWVLVSPLTPMIPTLDDLVVLTLAFGIPLGLVGVYLNHRAAGSEGRKQSR